MCVYEFGVGELIVYLVVVCGDELFFVLECLL